MPKTEPQLSLADSLLRTFDIHNRVTIYLLQSLDPACWLAPTPDGKGRNVASIAAHIHSVHCMWLKAGGSTTVPQVLDKATATIPQTVAALEQSAALMRALIAAALQSGARIKNFKPDAAAFLGYLIAHDSHHRGQLAMLARQTGHPLSKSASFGLWEWGTR